MGGLTSLEKGTLTEKGVMVWVGKGGPWPAW